MPRTHRDWTFLGVMTGRVRERIASRSPKKSPAEARLLCDFDGAALFEVPAESAKKAVSAVEAGEAKLLQRDERSAILEDAGRILDELFTGDANKAK